MTDESRGVPHPGTQCPHVMLAQWEEKAKNWMASPEAAQRLDGYRELAGKLAAAEESLAAKEAECKRLRAAAQEFLLLFSSGNSIPVDRVVLKPDHRIVEMFRAALAGGGEG
ncbi:MAG TPA: hypothetical protein PK916_09040 [Bacteroidota bacterium]|nr:hypothetical protein [Bacteroidota bacterium]